MYFGIVDFVFEVVLKKVIVVGSGVFEDYGCLMCLVVVLIFLFIFFVLILF